MQNLAARLVLTLAYASQFKFPLTTQELQLRLVSSEAVEEFEPLLSSMTTDAKGDSLLAVLTKLGKERVVQSKDDYWILTSALGEESLTDLIKRRQFKQRNSAQLKAGFSPLLSLVQRCNWIQAVAVTGSVAAGNADEKADLDLMVVVQDWLWLTRWLLLIWALFLGKKSWPWQKNQDQWCFNVFLKQAELALPHNKHNLYFAYEVCQADWVYDRNSTRCDFYQANQWVESYLPNWYQQLLQSAPSSKNKPEPSLSLTHIIAIFLKPFNVLAYKLQKRHLQRKNKIPAHNMSLGQAFLHDGVSYKKYLRLTLVEE
jgi:hypothetical protein